MCACVCVHICVHVCECMHVSALPVSMPCVYEERDIGRNNEDKKKDARRQGKPGEKVKKLEDRKRVQLHKDNGCDCGPLCLQLVGHCSNSQKCFVICIQFVYVLKYKLIKFQKM